MATRIEPGAATASSTSQPACETRPSDLTLGAPRIGSTRVVDARAERGVELVGGSGDSVTSIRRGHETGSVTTAVVPCPGVLVSSISPPWCVTIHCAIESPSPVPPGSRDRAGSAR